VLHEHFAYFLVPPEHFTFSNKALTLILEKLHK